MNKNSCVKIKCQTLVILGLLCFVLCACLTSDPNLDGTNNLIDSGLSSFTIPQEIDGETIQRLVTIKAPASLAPDKVYPVVFAFHGIGSQATSFVQNGRLNRLIDDGEFIGIYPNGHLNSWNLGKEQSTADDVAFVDLIMLELGLYDNLDLTQVYAIGYSNGSALVNLLGKETTYFNGIALLAGQQSDSQATLNAVSNALSVYQVNGTNDNVIPLDGGRSIVGHTFLPADESAENWAADFNCSATPTETNATWGDVETNSFFFENCESGHVVSYHVLDGVGHGIDIGSDMFFYEKIWTFFKTFAMAQR